jgi:hypothetical protein
MSRKSYIPAFVLVSDNMKSSTTCKGGIAPFLMDNLAFGSVEYESSSRYLLQKKLASLFLCLVTRISSYLPGNLYNPSIYLVRYSERRTNLAAL